MNDKSDMIGAATGKVEIKLLDRLHKNADSICGDMIAVRERLEIITERLHHHASAIVGEAPGSAEQPKDRVARPTIASGSIGAVDNELARAENILASIADIVSGPLSEAVDRYRQIA